MYVVLSAVENSQAKIVILARDAPATLRNQINEACALKNVSLFEVPHGQELGNAALLAAPTPVCALLTSDQDQQFHDLIESWEMMLYTIWALHVDLLGYDP